MSTQVVLRYCRGEGVELVDNPTDEDFLVFCVVDGTVMYVVDVSILKD
jgi:hypothetical protein